MEKLILEMIPSILDSFNNDQKKEEILESLKKFFLIECRYNMKVLATLRWENVSDEFKKEMIKSLRTDAAKALFSFTDKSKIKRLLELVKVRTNSKLNEEIKIVSVISKIEILKTLSSLNQDLQKDNKAIYKIRIQNLEKQIKEIVELLEQDLK